MSEQFRQPLGVALLGAVLWVVGMAGGESDGAERTTGDVLLQLAQIAGVLFLAFGAIWLVVLLLRPKRD